MPYVTSIERLAREEGLQEGRLESRQEGVAEGLQIVILKLLELKFKKVSANQARKPRSVRDLDQLETLLQAASTASALDEAFLPIEE